MPSPLPCRFRHAALIGKYHARGIRPLLEDVAHTLSRTGVEVYLEADTAHNTGMADYPSLTFDQIGRQCDVAVVVGGDGTMLGIAGGQLFGGLMSDTLGWRWAFGILAMLFLSVSALLQRHWAAVRQATSTPQASPGMRHQLAQVARDGWARTLLTIALIEGALIFGVMAIAATHLHTVHGVSLTTAGGVAALFGVGGMLYMASAKYTIRRFGEVGLARWGGTVMGGCFVVLGLTPWWPLAAPACLLAGFSFAMFHNTMQAKATQMVPSARATGVTLFAGFLFWGQSLGVLMLAHGLTLVPSGTLIALVAVCVVALGWYFAHAITQRNATQADHA